MTAIRGPMLQTVRAAASAAEKAYRASRSFYGPRIPWTAATK